MIPGLLDHLWQSTLLAGAAGLLTLLFRRNGAGVRFWLWFAASLKFLLPFAALATLGQMLARLFPAPIPSSLLAIEPAAARLSAPARMLAAQHGESLGLAPLLLGLWLAGLAVVLGLRLMRWSRLRAIMAGAQALPVAAPVAVKTSASLLEPGLVGIVSPVVLLPQGLLARLSDAECSAILAHELGHLRRRDNVTAAIHMAVEALFWFWPPVWLIGARLIAERERACDEAVLADGHDPEIYAGSILKVCRFCIQSPLACVPGASGADLTGRVRLIMAGGTARQLSAAKRLLLAGAATLVLALPVMAGFLNSPLVASVQNRVAAVRLQVSSSITRHVAAMEQQISPAPVRARRLPRLKIIAPQASLPATPSAAPQPDPVADVQLASVNDLEQAVTSSSVPGVEYPTGEGSLVAITCRKPRPLPDGNSGPKLCMHNHYWAILRGTGLDLSADGKNTFPQSAINQPSPKDGAQGASSALRG